jgi:hypothetical protein
MPAKHTLAALSIAEVGAAAAGLVSPVGSVAHPAAASMNMAVLQNQLEDFICK